VLRTYIAMEDSVDCKGACVAVAGPVKDGRGTLTNLNWEIDEPALARASQAERVAILNDLQAQGHAIGRLAEGSVRTLVDGPAAPAADATKLVVGVGTGFNIAPVYETPGGRFVPASEAGHANLPVRAEEELALIRYFETAHGFPAVEDIDPVARDAAQMFVRMLGTVSGNLSLIQLPFGGVYFAGGVARAFSAHFDALGFLTAFRDKGRFAGFMQNFAVHVIEDDYAALTGCATYLQNS